MCSVRNRAAVRNHDDLPLFQSAVRLQAPCRLSHAERFMLSHVPFRPVATLKLYAELAGLNVEGHGDV